LGETRNGQPDTKMTTLNDRTPIIIGVGQAAERPSDPNYRALSPADLAGEAALAAIADARAAGPLAASIDTLAAIRQFEISTPAAKPPFGASNNFPRSVARRIGANPRRAILEITGGQGPQRLVGEFCAAIAQGEAETVLLVGSEAMSTVLHLQAKGEAPDWSETVEGDMEDRGYGLDGMFTASLIKHRIRAPFPAMPSSRTRAGVDWASPGRPTPGIWANSSRPSLKSRRRIRSPQRRLPEALLNSSK